MQPLISIVICTYNRAEYLQKCLDSMLNQTYGNFEVIVVNGPSTDNTAGILRNYPFQTIQQIKKSGLSAARNLGIKEAKGEIIAFIDDDAVADKNWIKNLKKGYNDETIGGVGGIIYKARTTDVWQAKVVVNKFGVPKCIDEGEYYSLDDFYPCIVGCNMSFRKEVLLRVGCFDNYYKYYHDEIDICVRIVKAGYKLEYEPKAVVYHYCAEGPTRLDMHYHVVKNRLYFTLKNFGQELSLIEIILVDFKNFINEMTGVVVRFLRNRITLREFIKLSMNLIIGRIDGYKDGIKVRKRAQK